MNPSAERHLTKAESYLAKGEDFYRRAAEEIVAAKEADHTLSNRVIGERFGKTEVWVRDLVRWNTSASGRATPYGGDEHNSRSDRAKTKRILREAPMEQVEQIIADLPRERQKQVAAAAGHEYLKARTELDEEERDRTPAQRKEREAASEALSLPVRQATGGFAALGIAGHIEQATDELTELMADASLTPEALRAVLKADAAWRHELQVAAAMVGLEVDLQEVR